MPRRLGRRAAAPIAGRRLVVATYNIHTCVGVDRRYDPSRIAAVLAELEADIICLQEVDARHRHEGHRDQWAYFAAATGFNVVSGSAPRGHRGRFGNAILTRFPVLAVRHIDLSVGRYEPRGAIDADLLVEGRVLRVVATHLGLRAGERRHQIETLLETALARDTGADGILLMGDLNEWRGRRGGIRWLDRRLGRAPAPRTFPSWLPVLPLDRIYAAGAAALGSMSVHRSSLARLASDHLPLKAIVGFAALPESRQPL
jgi:endonuclease/exonuclease/phosphatase family metal-dependent hydrolase